MYGKSFVREALNMHTERSQNRTADNFRNWLNRDIPLWQIQLLIRAQSSDVSTMRAISEIGVAPEDTPKAIQLCKSRRFRALVDDGTQTGKYEWCDLPDLVDETVYVANQPDGSRVHDVWDEGAIVVVLSPDELVNRCSDVFGWEVL